MTAMGRGRRTPGPVGRTAGLLLSLALSAGLLAACAAAPARAGDPGDAQPVRGTYLDAYALRVDLLALQRSGEAAVAALRVTNVGSAARHLGLVLGTQDDTASAAGFALLDVPGRAVYLPLHADDGECVCSRFGAADATLAPGEARDVVVWLPAPDARRVAVVVPHAPPLLDVPLDAGTEPAPTPSGAPDPGAVSLRPPQVQRLVAVSDDLDTSATTEQDGEETRVRLSTDVLFRINEARLTPRARGVLEEVAARIDESGAEVVHVDGHTDITGGDAVNVPLSKRRARTVREELEDLVERDVRLQAEGHGSAEPVAPNDTEDGRRLNRRVTVSFPG